MNFKFLLAVFVVAVALMPTAHSNRGRNKERLKERLPGCQAGWSAFNGKCYKSFSKKKTWDEAENQCVKEEANLVSLHSEEEQQFVVGLNGSFPWLGGRRDPRKGNNFVWSDGTPWDYSNWASGQPSDDRGEEDCAHMWEWELRRNKWNDRPCSHERTFVCKKGKIVNLKPSCQPETFQGAFTEITLTKSFIRDNEDDGNLQTLVDTPDILSTTDYRRFIINFKITPTEFKIEVSKDGECFSFLERSWEAGSKPWPMPSYIAFSGYTDNPMHFRFPALDCSSILSSGGWKRVRHVPQGTTWHPVNDNLLGTGSYGNQNDDT